MRDTITATVVFNYDQAIALSVDTYAATIRDNFAIAVAVGSVDGSSASVGPGTRTVVDTGGLLGIATSATVITYTYFLRDNFGAWLAAGAIDGTSADTGPGTRSVTDTESKLNIGVR